MCTLIDAYVYFIFQPAEEGRAGARQMIDDGLFDLFPADCVFGLHNFPDVPQGHFAIKSGVMMASFDCFEIVLSGQATHAAMPQKGSDVFVAAAHIINALQTVVSRNVAPADSAVLSITQVHAGNTWNSIPDTAVIRGTYRCFTEANQQLIKGRLMQIAYTADHEHPYCSIVNTSLVHALGFVILPLSVHDQSNLTVFFA